MQLIHITEASQISGKSIQTIRRMIKQRKVQVKKQKTPQGFNYLVVKESLVDYLNQTPQVIEDENSTTQEFERTHKAITPNFEERFQREVERFNVTIQKLIEQNERDKSNFFNLIKTFQDRVLHLEGHIKLLEAPKKSWWQFWK